MSFLEQLDEEGYVVVDDVLDPDRDFGPLLDEYNEVLDGIASLLVDQGVLGCTYAELPFEARLIAVCRESGRNFPQHFDFTLPQKGITRETPIHAGPAVFRVVTQSHLLDRLSESHSAQPSQRPAAALPGNVHRCHSRSISAGGSGGAAADETR
jgi:phytanoyl-CoA hydroxylase